MNTTELAAIVTHANLHEHMPVIEALPFPDQCFIMRELCSREYPGWPFRKPEDCGAFAKWADKNIDAIKALPPDHDFSIPPAE